VNDKEGTMHGRSFISSVVAVIVTAVVAQAALAGGEPKNEWPFTRPVQARAVQSAYAAESTARIAAEAKNELPFTRRLAVTQTASVGSGDAKNELPFTRSAAAVVSEDSGSGFSWVDAALGLVLGVSLTLAAVGGTQLARHRVPRTA
jgi:hypothetical protein